MIKTIMPLMGLNESQVIALNQANKLKEDLNNFQSTENKIDNIGEFNLEQNDIREKIFYILAMIPYPSGAGMHLGHVMNYSAVDAIGRFKRYNGYKVLNPICWDSFGLPTENYAMKLGKKASEVTDTNIGNFKQQALKMSWLYDWNREFATSVPEYYKWTQWIFEKLFERGLIYRKESYINWCPKCNTALANDQVIDGKCERDETEIIQKLMPQWFIKITDYAERLIEDLKDLDWPEETKRTQLNWIGKKEGWILNFDIDNKTKLPVFITNLEYIEGISGVRVCPEHEILDKLVFVENKEKLQEYKFNAVKKTNLEREHLDKDGETLFLGNYIINPLNGKQIPLLIDDKILPTNGLGTEIMIPSINGNDKNIAESYNFSYINIKDENGNIRYGKGLNKEEYLGNLQSYIIEKNLGEEKIMYKLRDWSISRQRYWGSPIPVYYDEENNPHLIPEKELPVILPTDVENYKPVGKSPLEEHKTFPNYERNGKNYKRECNTLDTFVDSSFYYLRFLDPKNTQELISKEVSNIISNVDFYMGGQEHIVGHLLYARFIHKFLFDEGIVNTKEPFQKLFHQGMILASDGRKMSKRWGNVVDPMDILKKYEPDVLKTGILFLGPLEFTKSWDESSLKGIDNFFRKINSYLEKIQFSNIATNEELSLINSALKNITNDINNVNLNTAISKLIILFNSIQKLDYVTKETMNKFLIMLSIFAPSTAKQMWNNVGNNNEIFNEKWPSIDEGKIEIQNIKLPIQVNGKFKATINVPFGISQKDLLFKLNENGIISKYIGEKEIKKIVFVPNKIINFII